MERTAKCIPLLHPPLPLGFPNATATAHHPAAQQPSVVFATREVSPGRSQKSVSWLVGQSNSRSAGRTPWIPIFGAAARGDAEEGVLPLT